MSTSAMDAVDSGQPGSEDEDDPDFDFESIVKKAVQSLGTSGVEIHEIGLDTGVGPEQLYLTGKDIECGGNRSCFNTAATSGISRLSYDDFAIGAAPEAPRVLQHAREVRGAPVRPVDDKKIVKKEAKAMREKHLDGWFGLPKHKMTPELEKELKAIKLRANFDPKRFYKGNDSNKLPKYFAIATEVGGGMAAAGEKPTVVDPNARSGRSFLDEVLRDHKAQEYTWKRHGEVDSRGQASARSGHGKIRARKAAARGTKRGGTWKKTKRG